MIEFKNVNARGWLIIVISALFLTDITILLNISFLREISSFLFFTVIPGLLIIQIIKLNKIEFLKKFILAVGISISLLIFIGLILNSLYPFILKPLSLEPVFVSLNLLILLLAFIAYYRNRKYFEIFKFHDINIDFKNKLISPLIFPVIFPLLAILGTYLMNTTQNNVILLIMLTLIPVYIIVLVCLRDKIDKSSYPFSLFMISLSLLLMHGLTSNHLTGRDIQFEFYMFSISLKNFHWNLLDYYNPYNACLSITILPVIYKSLSNMNGEYIFKLLFSLGSLIPLLLYMIFQKYMNNRYAFLASFLFVFQTYFFIITVRQGIAFLFFFLAIWVYFSADFDKLFKKVFFLIFIISAMISHYTTAYISMTLIFPILLLPFIKSLFKGFKAVRTNNLYTNSNEIFSSKLSIFKSKLNFQNFDLICTILIFTFIWYLIAAKVQFQYGSAVVGTTISNIQINQGSVAPTRNSAVLGVLGVGIQSMPNLISVIVNNTIFIMICIGLISIIKNYRKFKKKFGSSYILGALISVFILASFVILPYISNAYGPQRLFLQLTVFLAPLFIIGCIKFANIIKKPKFNVIIILILLVSLFTCGTYLQYHLLGDPYSPFYEKEGSLRDEYYIYDQELIAVSWLKQNKLDNLGIQTDYIGNLRIVLGFNGIDIPKVKNNKTKAGYIYLGYVNVNKNIIYTAADTPVKVNNFTFLDGRSKIYGNGGAEIWK